MLFRVEIECNLAANSNDHYLVAKLKEEMLEKLDERFPITEEMLIATLLDPRLQNLPRLLENLNKRGTTKFDIIKRNV